MPPTPLVLLLGLSSPAPPAFARSRAVVRELERAAAGLFYVSEADSPLAVVHFPAGRGPPAAAAIARATGHAHAPCREQSLEAFFATAVTPQPWHGPVEQTSVRRFRALLLILRTQLRDTRVFRFGTLDIDAYVVGVTSAGDWAGLHAHLVET